MNPSEIRDADIIVGRILLNDFSIVGQKGGEDYHSLNKHMINLVYEKKPKAIVLETAGLGINSMRKICDCYVNRGYHIYYKRLAGQSYSGLPFYDVRIYVVGIRKDLDSREEHMYIKILRLNL